MRAGMRTQRKAARTLAHGVVKTSSTPNESESVTRSNRETGRKRPLPGNNNFAEDVYQRLSVSQKERRNRNHQRKNRHKNQDPFQEETGRYF